MREGNGTLKPVKGEILYIDGLYVRDQMDGKGKIEYKNGDVLYAWFAKGTLHGLGKGLYFGTFILLVYIAFFTI